MIRCPGCGGNNSAAAGTCDWCGRPFRESATPAALKKYLFPLLAGVALMLVAGVALAIILSRGRSTPAPPLTPTLGAAASPLPSPPATTPTVIPTVTPRPAATEAPARARVTNTNGQGALIRREPSVNAASLGLVPEGALITLMGPEETVQAQVWKQVDDGDGHQGWIRADFLLLSEPTSAPVAPVP